MKERITSEISRIREDKTLMGRIYLITLGTALLVLAVCIRGPEQMGRIVTDEDGKAVAIERHSTNSSESYDFEVLISEGAEVIRKNVNITIQAVRREKEGLGIADEQSREDEIDAGLTGVVNEIEYSRKKKISLPANLSDGTPITWKARIKKDYSYFFLIPAIYLALIAFAVRSGKSGEKEEEAKRRSAILRSLPRFCNQLFLMMNAGMILSDAFGTISESYAGRIKDEGDDRNYFEREIASLYHKDPDHRTSTAALINEFAVKNDVKEMIRIATILTENEKRGSDVIESLSRESRYLWDERKTVARESGKMIDTKMSYPLGVLLILLIVITMAPAMLSM